MKKIISTFFLLLTFCFYTNFYSQENNITFITFENYNSSAIGGEIEISIYPNDSRSKATVEVKTPTEKKIEISIEKYNEICESLLQISPKDIIEDFKVMLDGATTEIKFGDGFNRVSYSIHGLNVDDQKTAYKNFLNSTLIILNTVQIKIPNLY